MHIGQRRQLLSAMNELNVSLQHDDEQELKKLEVFVPAGHEFTGRQIVDIQWPEVHQPVILPKIGPIALPSPSAAPLCLAEEFRRAPRQNLLRKIQLMQRGKAVIWR